jgi:hypothetical protein
MDNFIIAIPSKGRVTSPTLGYLKNVVNFPVYVYADEKEASAYEEYYPEFNVVPHNKKNIAAIRRLIQEEQAAAGNTVFMLDDDILGFYDNTSEYSVSMREILDGIEDSLEEGYDFIGLGIMSQKGKIDYTNKNVLFYGVATILTPGLWAKGVRFMEEDISDDLDFSIQLELHKDAVRTVRLPYYAKHTLNDPTTHFGDAWYTRSAIEMYKKYGRIIRLSLNIDRMSNDIDPTRFDEFKERGPVYTKAANNMLISLYENKFIDEEFILDALEVCGCKRGDDGKYCFDWDYDGYDGSMGDIEALLHGHNCPCCNTHSSS